jgi:glycosyltransferase involved in cell wall biosynthesis
MRDEQYKTSVVIPCYNQASTLARAILSALNQTLPPAEVVVVDDGSTDGSKGVAESFGTAVIYIRQQNRGPAAARNLGVRNATGEFLGFLDADDWWSPEFVARCSELLRAHITCIAASTGLSFVQSDGSFAYGPADCFDGNKPIGSPRVLESFFAFWAQHNHVCTGSVLMRRKAILEVGMQNESLWAAEDLEFWALLGAHGRWGFIPEALWVCDSRRAAGGRHGRLQKDRSRMEAVPSMHQWEARILPRLRPEDLPYYRKIRGKLAAGLAFSKIMCHQDEQALELIRTYAEDLDGASKAGRYFHAAAKLGPAAWLALCTALRIRRKVQSLW